MSAVAASTDRNAVRRCGVTCAAYSGDALEGPDHDVLASREVEERVARQLDRRDRRELDLTLRRLQVPRLVVDLRAEERPAVDRIEAVALGKEPFERFRL